MLPAATAQGNPGENTLLPQTASELQRLGLCPREVALDGGFQTGPTAETLKSLGPERTFVAGRQQPGSRRTQRRLQRYRTGAEGRISHLKRGYRLSRSRPQRRPRPADLDRMGHPDLQPRHLHPTGLTQRGRRTSQTPKAARIESDPLPDASDFPPQRR